jgi:tyrosine-specific transport protein
MTGARAAERLVGIGVMLGTVIGAGFLALPYAAARAGIATVLMFLAALALVVTLLHVAYGDVVLATVGRHRLPGYAERYLGQWGKRIAGVSAFVGQLGGLLVYLLFGGSFISVLLPAEFSWWGTAIFWAMLTGLLLLKFRTSALIDAAASWCLVAVLVGISFAAFERISPEYVRWSGSPSAWLLPYGIVMFSLMGLAAVPELAAFDALREKRALVSVLVSGIVGAAILYAGFTWTVFGALGPTVSPNAFLDMHALLPQWAGWVLPIAGLVAIGTSYFTFGVSVRNVLTMDFGMRRDAASALVAFVPIALFLSGLRDIARIIGFLGGVWISIDAITILLIRERLHELQKTEDGVVWRKKIIGRALMLVFILGAISSLFVLT